MQFNLALDPLRETARDRLLALHENRSLTDLPLPKLTVISADS